MKTLTPDQRDRIAEAFDLVRSVFSEVRDEKGMTRIANRLDKVLGLLYNLFDYF